MRPALEEGVLDMPPSPFNNFTDCWIGIGLRASHHDHPIIDPRWKLYSRAIERGGNHHHASGMGRQHSIV